MATNTRVPIYECMIAEKNSVKNTDPKYETVNSSRSRDNKCIVCARGPRSRAIPLIVQRLPSENAVANFCGDRIIIGSDMNDIVKQNSASTAQPANPIHRCTIVSPNHSPLVLVLMVSPLLPMPVIPEIAFPAPDAMLLAPSRSPLNSRLPLDSPSESVDGSTWFDDDVFSPPRASLIEGMTN
ncbi:hypothetical protein GGH99_001156 [Coemansia sp. RSA 1285]|nr:hypothetical protein EV177_000688 [Coemansia sp. RSA 1804]KAJ2693449.1 hypothetical protein GGH99_001156 [Coemansia sp. RSA 1285]